MKEAMLYQKLDDGKVKCGVCPHRCTIADGKRGICGVRENRQGTLYALNYGKAVAVAIEPIEKKPLFHFLPRTQIYSFATVGCNLRCLWCQNWDISQNPKPNRPIIRRRYHAGRTCEKGSRSRCAFDCLYVYGTHHFCGVCPRYDEVGQGKGIEKCLEDGGLYDKGDA